MSNGEREIEGSRYQRQRSRRCTSPNASINAAITFRYIAEAIACGRGMPMSKAVQIARGKYPAAFAKLQQGQRDTDDEELL